MFRRFSYILFFSVAVTALNSCREGYTVPFYVGCSPDSEPFCYIDENGQLKGIEIDFINAVGEDQGIWFDFIQTNQEDLLSELKAKHHKMDCGISMIEWTNERENDYSYVNPAYYTSSIALATVKGSKISSLDDMSGKIMAVKAASLAEKYASELAAEYGFTVKSFSTYNEVLKAVENGQADACEEHYDIIQYRIDKKGANLQIIDPGVKNISFAIITQKDEDKTLRNYLYEGLANLYLDKKFQVIIDRYLK